MHAVEQGGQCWQDDDGEADPVAGVEADGGKDEKQSGVGRVADEAEDAGLLQGLLGTDGDVDAERFAESDDGDPADDQADDEDGYGCGPDFGRAVSDVVGMGAAVPVAGSDGEADDEPEEVEGATILQFAAAAAGAQEDGGKDLGDDPGPVCDGSDEMCELDGAPRVVWSGTADEYAGGEDECSANDDLQAG